MMTSWRLFTTVLNADVLIQRSHDSVQLAIWSFSNSDSITRSEAHKQGFTVPPIALPQTLVLRWLLHHDPGQRPAAMELLHSGKLPPPQLERSGLHEALQSTLAMPHSKAYRSLVDRMFAQRITIAADFAYDADIHKVSASCFVVPGPLFIFYFKIATCPQLLPIHTLPKVETSNPPRG